MSERTSPRTQAGLGLVARGKAPSPPISATQLPANIDVWPGAGGGMLVSLSLLTVGEPFPRHWDLPNFFIRICPWGRHALLAPYISLGDTAKAWLREIVGDELSMGGASIPVFDKPGDTTFRDAFIPGALFKSEWQLRAMASVCKDLILAEAAETWDVEKADCTLCDGFALYDGGIRLLSISSLASGASIQPLLTDTELRCGRRVVVASSRASVLKAMECADRN
jgi:isoquinoline 1-oxidoreductase beta subunit